MDVLLDIVKFTLPSLIAIFGIYFVMDKLLRDESQRREFELKKLNNNVITPIKLRAYERLALFLERSTPDAMILRNDISILDAMQLQGLLLKTLREEYDHNVSQQIYVSNELWILIQQVRENTAQLINETAARVKPQTSAVDYAKLLIGMYASVDETPAETALNFLKSEVGEL